MNGHRSGQSCETDATARQAAWLAATWYATDADRAVACFADLTGRSAFFLAGGRDELEEEMRALLPVFRTPVHGEGSEYILFFDPEGPPKVTSSRPEATSEANRGQRAFRVYVRLVRGGGMSRRQALTRVREQFAYADDQAALVALAAEMDAVILRWQQSAPCMVQTLLDTRWLGLLPDL